MWKILTIDSHFRRSYSTVRLRSVWPVHRFIYDTVCTGADVGTIANRMASSEAIG
jgi:hypothetical protein